MLIKHGDCEITQIISSKTEIDDENIDDKNAQMSLELVKEETEKNQKDKDNNEVEIKNKE